HPNDPVELREVVVLASARLKAFWDVVWRIGEVADRTQDVQTDIEPESPELATDRRVGEAGPERTCAGAHRRAGGAAGRPRADREDATQGRFAEGDGRRSAVHLDALDVTE